MSEQKPHCLSHRFSVTQQYGLAGWVVLAAIVALGSALIAVTASSGNIARATVHGTLTRSETVVCNASGDASGAMDQVAFIDDSLRQMSLCQ